VASVVDAEHGVANVLVDAAPAPAVAPGGAARQGGVEPRGLRGEHAVQDGEGLRQVARERQPEAERRREVERLHEPPRRHERQQVEPHLPSCRSRKMPDPATAAGGYISSPPLLVGSCGKCCPVSRSRVHLFCRRANPSLRLELSPPRGMAACPCGLSRPRTRQDVRADSSNVAATLVEWWCTGGGGGSRCLPEGVAAFPSCERLRGEREPP
jgi:hypothetical protein